MRVESFGDARAVSQKGAIGLMQVMPKTYAELRVRHRLGADPCDPHDNILAGAAYLREMLDRYGAPGFLAAYNAGPARYDEHLMKGRPLPGETQDYVAKLAPMIGVQQGDDRNAARVRSLRLVARGAVSPARRSVSGRSFACSQSAAGSFPGRPSRRRSFGARPEFRRPVRPLGERDGLAMMGLTLHRTLEGHIAGSGLNRGWPQGLRPRKAR